MAAARNNEFKLFGPRERDSHSGSAVTLSCHLSPEISAVAMEIRWFKGTDCVCLYKNRQVTEGRGYEGRVSLFPQELQRGNVSLQIRDCGESDLGYYLCQVTNGDTTEECTVGVTWLKHVLLKGCLDPTYRVRLEFRVQQRNREWTEEERKKMKDSLLLTVFSEEAKHEDIESIIMERKSQLMEKDKQIQEKEKLLTETKYKLDQMTKETETQLKDKDSQLETLRKELQDNSRKLDQQKTELTRQQKELEEKEQQLKHTAQQNSDLQTETETQKILISSQTTGAAFVDKHRKELIQRVLSVMEIVDCLHSKNMITDEMYSNIQATQTSQEQMRILYRVLDSGGKAVKAEFYKVLKEKQPFLVDELEA